MNSMNDPRRPGDPTDLGCLVQLGLIIAALLMIALGVRLFVWVWP